MIAWVAARKDAPNYGTTRVYRFPADTTIFGPAQIEARIDQDPIISAQITLWNQSGSKVIRGNLIVVPLGDSLIYLQPVYLQSTGVGVPGVPADRRGVAAQGRLGADPRDRARAPARRPRRTAAGRPRRRRPDPVAVAGPGRIADAGADAVERARSSRCRPTSPG